MDDLTSLYNNIIFDRFARTYFYNLKYVCDREIASVALTFS